MAKAIFNCSEDEWGNLQNLRNQLNYLIEHKDSPKKLTAIERTKLRIVIKSIAGFAGE